MEAAEVLKQILCPRCNGQIHLLKEDFTVTTENERGEWSCDPAVICPWDGCGVEFFVTQSRAEYVQPKANEEKK